MLLPILCGTRIRALPGWDEDGDFSEGESRVRDRPAGASRADNGGSRAPGPGERAARLLDAVRDYGIFALDDTGSITTWNAGAERLTGYVAGEVTVTRSTSSERSDPV